MVNTNPQNTFLERPTDVEEDNAFSPLFCTPLTEFVPSYHLDRWRTQVPPVGSNVVSFAVDYTFREFLINLQPGFNELSGVVGHTWATYNTGGPDWAPFQDGLFIWHYHSDNDCRFSLQDWVSFVLSNAYIGLLVTRSAACLFEKKMNGKWVEIRKRIAQTDQRALRLMRFKKGIENLDANKDINLINDQKISDHLGIFYRFYE